MDIRSKTCRACNEIKPVSEFYAKSDGARKGKDYSASLAGYSHQCKSCDRQIAANRRRARGKAHVDYIKNGDLKRKYGISLDVFNEMLLAQGNGCAICGRHCNDFAKGLAVDHDHKTGLVRSLLCPKCNLGLGSFCDDMGLLAKAIEYLNKHAIENGVGEPTASGKVAIDSAERNESSAH